MCHTSIIEDEMYRMCFAGARGPRRLGEARIVHEGLATKEAKSEVEFELKLEKLVFKRKV